MQKEIEKLLNEEVRPMLSMHSGDVGLIEVGNDGTVKVRLTGGCFGCPAAQITLAEVVENAIKSKFPQIKKVEMG